tara:strand:+ start:687 stop:1400 length:714 start_codon:yes stop_codon:yes gene_type:complete
MILKKSSNQSYILSVIIPTINESKNLPLLLSDLSERRNTEILIIDSISKDKTEDISSIYGVKFFQLKEKNRGLQLDFGAKKATGKWLLFIHADSRLKENWSEEINSIMQRDSPLVYFFKFRINNQKIIYRFFEFFVNMRCFFFNEPYGDQGLLIKKNKYFKNEGFKKIPLMEDIDFIKRIKKKEYLVCLENSIYTSSRKWDRNNFLIQSFRNWKLRKRWLKGDPMNLIYDDYYKSKD